MLFIECIIVYAREPQYGYKAMAVARDYRLGYGLGAAMIGIASLRLAGNLREGI